jgi:hypothetical protein
MIPVLLPRLPTWRWFDGSSISTLAESLYRRALTIEDRALGPEHQEVF